MQQTFLLRTDRQTDGQTHGGKTGPTITIFPEVNTQPQV